MKIHTVKIYNEFDAPVSDVWEAFSDHEQFGKMMEMEVKRVVDSSDPGNINGLDSVRRIGKGFISFEETIRKSEKPNVIEYQISKGTPLHHHYGVMIFKDLPGNRSAIDYTIEIGSRYPLLGLLVKNALKASIGSSIRHYANSLKKGT